MYTVFDYGEDERLRDVNLRELIEFVREITSTSSAKNYFF